MKIVIKVTFIDSLGGPGALAAVFEPVDDCFSRLKQESVLSFRRL